MNDDLEQLLKNLKMGAMREVVERELARAQKQKSSYADFLARLLRELYQLQKARSLEYRIERAKLPDRWTLETFPFQAQPGVHEPTIKQLAELDFVAKKENIVFVGPTGTGKSGLASAILLKALENGYRGLFVRAQDLFDEMGYLNLRPEQTNLFFKLMEERYSRRSTLITTNLDYDDWYGFLGRKEMVGALLDRLRHHCHTVRIDGPSLREPQS